MDCPRCKLPLREVRYESCQTEMCDNCWGLWLDTGELEGVLNDHTFSLSDEERSHVLDAMTASHPGPQDPIPCPACGKVMDRVHYDQSVHIVLDRCADHGIWFDTGEVKRIEAVSDTSEKIHQMVVRKLGLKSKS